MSGQNSSTVVVGISTRNRASELPKAINSALAQSYRPLAVSVVDDASTDTTPLVKSQFPTVVWRRNEVNLGLIHTRNSLMLGAVEDYYVSLDDDAWFLEGDEIARAVAYLEMHSNAAAVAFDILSPNAPQQSGRNAALAVASFIGCGHVLRLDAVRKLGGYSESPGSYGGEESDLCIRLIDSGYDIVKLTGVHVWHDKSETARDERQRRRSAVCNDLASSLRRAPGTLLAPVMAWKLTLHTIFGVRRGLLLETVKGTWDFARASLRTWRDRRPVSWTAAFKFRSLSKHPRPLR